MKSIALQKLRLWRIVPALAAFLLVAGCADVLTAPPDSPEAGRVAITIGSPARTVAPRLDQFSRVEITFQRMDGPGTLAPLAVTGGAAIVYLPPGTWELTASAYNNGEPPELAAQAANTLARTGGGIIGETNFVLAPTGTGPGILEYAFVLPPGLEAAAGTLRIEQGGELLEETPLNGGGALSLERGRYVVEMVFNHPTNGTVAVCREAAVILPGLSTGISFSPGAEDFLDPGVRAALTEAPEFAVTGKNSSRSRIEESGGAGAARTQRLSAPRGTAAVYFVLKKTAAQTVTITGADAAKALQGAADGESPSATRALFTVDSSGLIVGDMTFALALAEEYKETVVVDVTLTLGLIQTLSIEKAPDKITYIQGETPFDPTGMVISGIYADGSLLGEPDLSGYRIAGFDTSSPGEKTLQVSVRGKIAGTLVINVVALEDRKIFFDYGQRHSSSDTQPDRYSVPLGRTLVLAPAKWHVPDNAVYEWKVDGATQSSATEYLSFKPTAQGNYAVTVTAKINGQPLSSASTTVACVEPEGTYQRTGGYGASQLYKQVYSPGQFTPGGGREISHPNFSLGAWGGYIVFKFDRSVTRSVRIAGNSFGGWNEPGTVWVMQDENGNGLPDDTWYELEGSNASIAKRRYVVAYQRDGSRSKWTDNLGNMGTLGNYPTGSPSPMTFVGTGLVGSSGSDNWSGYVDAAGSPVFYISKAVQADGSPIELAYIDFVKVQTGLNEYAGSSGEVSTEIYGLPQDYSNGPTDPAMLITGAAAGSGQYSYQFVNSSGYDLHIILFPDLEFDLIVGDTVTKTIALGQAYYDYYGGNVAATKTTGRVAFVDRP